ncbi:FAD-linked oxidoreductase sor8 [Apiospora arundinis]
MRFSRCSLELHQLRGVRLSEYAKTTYNFGRLCGSAQKLGCHVCALFESSLWTRPQDFGDSRMWNWTVAFTLLPATDPNAILMITIECSGANSLCGHGLPLCCNDREAAYDQGLPVPAEKQSLGKCTGDMDTFDVAKTWFDPCLKEHSLCAQIDAEFRAVRPRRMLHLDNAVRLAESAAAAGQDYVSLSHCWGRQTYPSRCGVLEDYWEGGSDTSGYGASPLHSRLGSSRNDSFVAAHLVIWGKRHLLRSAHCAAASESHPVEWHGMERKQENMAATLGRSPTTKQTGCQTKADCDLVERSLDQSLDACSSCEARMKTDKIVAIMGLISKIERLYRSTTAVYADPGLSDYDLPGMAL